ncbi:MAG: hypothetical protein JKY67_08220 [Pseudomonadales bacterium]|nr:hypothetical protein [Pseudomonadales bacterium]
MNNRAYLRQSLALKAQFTIGYSRPTDCIIQDFCSGGVYLTYVRDPDDDSFDDAHIQRGDCVSLLVTISGHYFQMQAKLAHLMDGALGLEFSEPDPVALAALQNVAESNGTVAEDKKLSQLANRSVYDKEAVPTQGRSKKLDLPKLKQVLKKLCITTEDYIMPLFEVVFPQIENNLISEATKVDKKRDKNIYFHALPTIDREKEVIQAI